MQLSGDVPPWEHDDGFRGADVTQQYLLGELSVRLELLQGTAGAAAPEVARLRREVETLPPSALIPVLTRILALADLLCWDSLGRGDTAAFERQAAIFGELRRFGEYSGLLGE